MAITNAQVDAFEDWSDARTLKAARQARINLLLGGQSVSVAGRTFNRADLAALNELITALENTVAAAGSSTGTMTAYGSFDKQQ